MSASPTDRTAEFVQLWTRHSRHLYSYILTLVFDVNLANDVLQDTAATSWEQFSEFAPGSSFYAWSCRIAYFKSLTALKARKPQLYARLDPR